MAGEFSDGEFDLFGDPVLPERGPGRPPHVPTKESRQFVNMMFVCGHGPLDVAKALGLKKTAFYEHYRHEISERAAAKLKFRGRQLIRLNKLAEAGNVAAEKALAGMIQAEQVKAAGASLVANRRGKPAEKIKPLGKKQAAKEAAINAAGRYGRREPPQLLMH